MLVYDLQRELYQVRRNALQASRSGDFLKAARLTARAGSLNRSILAAEGQSFALKLH